MFYVRTPTGISILQGSRQEIREMVQMVADGAKVLWKGVHYPESYCDCDAIVDPSPKLIEWLKRERKRRKNQQRKNAA